MATTPPYLGVIAAGDDFFPVSDQRDIEAIEIAATRDAADWYPMAAIVPGHYDLVHRLLPPAPGFLPADHVVAAVDNRAMPTYFSRRPSGLRLHPTADKQYWIRVIYRAPIGHAIPADRV